MRTRYSKNNSRIVDGREPFPEPPSRPSVFASIEDVLDAAMVMFSMRNERNKILVHLQHELNQKETRQELKNATRLENAWCRYWHRSFVLTGDKIDLCKRCRKSRLNRLEREILLSLILGYLGMGGLIERSRDCRTILSFLHLKGTDALDAMRYMSENGRLYRTKLIFYLDEDEPLLYRELILNPVIIDIILAGDQKHQRGLGINSESDLYKKLFGLTSALQKKSSEPEWAIMGGENRSDFFSQRMKVDHRLGLLLETLSLHEDWSLTKLLAMPGVRTKQAMLIVLALVGKELGHLPADEELFKGAGLSRAASDNKEQVTEVLRLLDQDGYLVSKGFVRVCEDGFLIREGQDQNEDREFALGARSIELLRIKKKVVKKIHGPGSDIRKPMVSMDQLVLSKKVKSALSMVIAQAKHSAVLLNDWGFAHSIPYGKAITVLFSGPPGVGKTACAEATADQLNLPILVANYSQIQNADVGRTSKNIVQAFNTATKESAVLFWDEADAMFYNRDMAHNTWEVRDVNVLLQQLEIFEGVCILATNRNVSLDPALERRLAIKVEFGRPDKTMRKKIWLKLIPQSMPTGSDVDIDYLSQVDLSGGEIKNVVLNAARIALARRGGPVEMPDFIAALEMESRGKFMSYGERIGFRKN